MNVLLNTTPPRLGYLWIQSGAQLVWANTHSLQLTVGYIRVDGQFHVGGHSPDCRITEKARILLQGTGEWGREGRG